MYQLLSFLLQWLMCYIIVGFLIFFCFSLGNSNHVVEKIINYFKKLYTESIKSGIFSVTNRTVSF